MDAERLAEKLQLRTCHRPITPGGDEHFDLAFVTTWGDRDRSGREPPIVFVPGGPGMASVAPFLPLRQAAVRRDLDVVMVEHRGVGFSRRDAHGVDLPPEALTLVQAADDLVAVLDALDVESAVFHGTSYGSYLVQLAALRHPDRIAGLVLDSPMSRASDHTRVRDHRRALLWDGAAPTTARAAELLRAAAASGAVDAARATGVVQPVYEFAGARYLERLLELRLRGRAGRLWDRIEQLGVQETTRPIDHVMEFDLVGRIAFRELDYAEQADGGPLDVPPTFLAEAEAFPPFEGEPADLHAAQRDMAWPVAVISGERDLRTPRPLAQEVVDRAPDAVLVPLNGTGHSAMDTHQLAALHVAHAVQVGGHHRLPQLADRIADLPRRGASANLTTMLRAAIDLHRLLPAPLAR